MEVAGRVSRHNSDNDVLDDGLWEEFCHRVRMIAREHRYERLGLDVFGGSREP